MNDYFPRAFIKELDSSMLGTKVCITGMVVNVKTKDKFASLWIDDSTAVVEAILFKPSEMKIDITIGATIQVVGEFDQDRFQNEGIGRVKIMKYSIIKDINLELHNYCATFYEKQQHNEKLNDAMVSEEDTKAEEEKKVKRIPLNREKLKTKLRTLIIKCLWQTRKITNSQQAFPLTLKELKNFPAIIVFCQKENLDLENDLTKVILELERLAFLYPNTQGSFTNEISYLVDLSKLDKLEGMMLNLVKPKGAQGISIDKLYEELNSKIDPEINVLSKEYIWEIANFLFEKNEIYLSKNDVLHYCERLV